MNQPKNEAMRANDGIWLQDRPSNRMLIHAVLFTEPLEIDRFREIFQKRLVERDGGSRYQRLRQAVVRKGARFFWRTQGDFDIAKQIVEADDPALKTERGLQDYIGRMASVELPPDLPPWRVDVIRDYAGDRTALYFRIHHCMADGIALVRMLFETVDPADLSRPANQRRGSRSRAAQMLQLPFMGPAILGRLVASPADRSPLHGSPLQGTKRVTWSGPLDLARIKNIKEQVGATVNDVLMAALAGAFNRYLGEHPDAPLGEVRASVPLNIRSAKAPERMENNFVAVLFRLPAGILDPLERVREVRRRMIRLKDSVEPMVMLGTIRFLLGVFPGRISRGLIDFFANKCTCVLTNVPGPPQPVHLGGKQILDFMFWVPQRAEIGIGISILSYAGAVRIGIIADTERMAEPQEFVEAFELELDALERAAATDRVGASRRI